MAGPEAGPSFLLSGLAAAATPAGRDAPLRGPAAYSVEVVSPAAIAVVEGRIAAVGPPGEVEGDHAGLEPVARSVDHLEATGRAGAAMLAQSEVAAVMLPVAALYLRRPAPPARALIDAGAIAVLATDFNPGSAYCDSLPAVMTLACTQLAMTPADALCACTVNAAWVLGRADRVGRLAPGYDADIVLLDAPDWRHVAYHLAGRDIAAVYKRGVRL